MADQTNPKDLLGVKKINVGLFPAAGTLYGALAMEDGAVKYGPYNWRDKHVKFTVYLDAAERHIKALRDGQNNAPDSGKPHLAHAIACLGILADAVEGDFIVDDRPLPGPAAKIIAKYVKSDPKPNCLEPPQTGFEAANAVHGIDCTCRYGSEGLEDVDPICPFHGVCPITDSLRQ